MKDSYEKDWGIRLAKPWDQPKWYIGDNSKNSPYKKEILSAIFGTNKGKVQL